MALKDLTAQAMVAISSRWIDEKQDRALLEKHALLSPLVPIIDAAHRGLLNTQMGSSKQAQLKDQLKDQAQSADLLYDRKARAVFHLLTGFAEYVDDVSGTARILDVRDELFPNGLKITQRSFLDQATEASVFWERLSEVSRTQLAELPVPGGTLEKAVREWIAAGQKLGRVELAKAEMRSRAEDGLSVTSTDVLRARNQWVRAARGLITMISCENVSEGEEAQLLGPLREAEMKAERGS